VVDLTMGLHTHQNGYLHLSVKDNKR
jgi:hypothetical protein